jgi:hypothetical protein
VIAAKIGRFGAGLRFFEDADDLLLGEPGFLHEGDSDRAILPGILSPLSGHFHGATSNREYAHAYLRSHPCIDCGETDPIVLEFDHIGIKEANIGDLIARGGRLDRLQIEISRCGYDVQIATGGEPRGSSGGQKE